METHRTKHGEAEVTVGQVFVSPEHLVAADEIRAFSRLVNESNPLHSGVGRARDCDRGHIGKRDY
jgi:hypothetical protein